MGKGKKIQLSEVELARKQAEKMLKDMGRLQATQKGSLDQKKVREGVDLWKDTDFFFSVVFQSSAQKYAFLEAFSKKFGLGIDNAMAGDEVYQIINGLKLAANLGIKIPAEKSVKFPYPNLELAQLALDNNKES